MARDYAKPRSRKASKRSGNGILSFFSGLLLGGIAVAVLILKPAFLFDQSSETEQSAESKGSGSRTLAAKKPSFDFYTILPEMEVVIPSPEEEAAALAAAATKPVIPKPDALESAAQIAALESAKSTETPPTDLAIKPSTDTYVLQLASFKSFNDADELKAKLTLMGFNVLIQTISLPTGETWHRVRTGPFKELQTAESIRQQLQAQEINSLVLKLKS